jgi:type I restriction enzyme S subunit
VREGWKTTRLRDVCTFENGDRGKNYPGRKAFVPTGIPFINAGHLDKGEINWQSMDYIPRERFELLGNGKVRKDDLLFCLRGSLGKFAVVKKDTEGAIASSLVIVRPKNQLDCDFLADYFLSSICAEMIAKYANGAAQPNLSAKSLKKFEIPLPPLPEQKQIVAILDKAFEGIDKAVANAEKNLANARELFESYLNSIFTKQGGGWKHVVIGDIAQVKGGKRVPKGYKLQEEPTKHPYISVSDFNDSGSVDLDKIRYVSEGVYNQISRYTISRDDLYISIAGTIGKSGIIPEELEGANLTENACKLVLQEGVLNRYLYFFTRTNSFIEQALKNTRTAAQPKLALERLKTIRLSIPPIGVQKKLVEQFCDLWAETQCLESIYQQYHTLLTELKQSILQKAFTGELTAESAETIKDEAVA